jgi:ubiquinone/menaquinone biosynthesis C-methylase UbiE
MKMYKSETSKFRNLLEKYCQGCGLDIGFGGDIIITEAISIDLEKPYAKTGNHPLNLKGNAKKLYWFKDSVLDYVYSSHLLEDFDKTDEVLREWHRVIKPNGILILLLPNEQRYRRYRQSLGKTGNPQHKHLDFSLTKVKSILESLNMTIIKEYDPLIYKPENSDYNFAIIAKK